MDCLVKVWFENIFVIHLAYWNILWFRSLSNIQTKINFRFANPMVQLAYIEASLYQSKESLSTAQLILASSTPQKCSCLPRDKTLTSLKPGHWLRWWLSVPAPCHILGTLLGDVSLGFLDIDSFSGFQIFMLLKEKMQQIKIISVSRTFGILATVPFLFRSWRWSIIFQKIFKVRWLILSTFCAFRNAHAIRAERNLVQIILRLRKGYREERRLEGDVQRSAVECLQRNGRSAGVGHLWRDQEIYQEIIRKYFLRKL